jgi:hypothetical protein
MDVKNLKLKRVPSKGALSKMCKQQEHNLIKALLKKHMKESQVSELEDKLSPWFQQIKMKHGVLTDDFFSCLSSWEPERDGKILFFCIKTAWMMYYLFMIDNTYL